MQYAAVTTETRTGAILALIGGRNFSHSRFDRTRSSRDLGSAFEPFVAAAAAERGKLVLPGKPVQTGRQIGPAEVERIAKRCGIAGPFLETEDLFRGSVAATPHGNVRRPRHPRQQGQTPETLPHPRNPRRLRRGHLHRQTRISPTPSARPPRSMPPACCSRKNGTRNFTGATGSERDAWTLRLGPSGATAIWIGFDKPTAIRRRVFP